MVIFRVEKIFDLKIRNWLVLGGTILDGIVRKGMTIEKKGESVTIHGIEFIDRLAEDTSKSLLALTISYENDKDLERLQKLFTEGETIEIK